MSVRPRRRALASAVIAAAILAGGFRSSSAQEEFINLGPALNGPSSSASPYIVPVGAQVSTTAILTVGDSVNNKPDGVTPYRLVGIPDGIGAYDNGDDTFTLLMNHELGPVVGVARAHGAIGSFVSKWTIRKSDFGVIKGEDLIQNVATWNTTTGAFNAPAKGVVMGRLCSGDLPKLSAFFNSATGNGFNGRILMSGEEVGNEGRVFGHLLDGDSFELPRLGKFSWENAVANPATGDKTVVVGTDDTTPGQVYVYVGAKTNAGNAVTRAGLTNGQLYGVKVEGVASENRTSGIAPGTRFTLHNHGDITNTTGAALQTASVAAGVTEFLRPEDGAWDPNNPNHFYFVTTDRFDQTKNGTGAQIGRSRLWRLRFNDAATPESGGRIDMLLDGTEAHQMLDNMTVDTRGQVYMQEDPGNQSYIARIWRYSISTDTLTLVGFHDFNRFTPGAPNFVTQDEESSGIIDVSDILGDGWMLLNVQAHKDIGGELVEDGQMLAMRDQTSFAATPSATIQFGAATFAASEGSNGAATITVTRTGDTSGTSTVAYRVGDLTAKQKTDFTFAAGTLTFAPGETSKGFQVVITEDAFAEGTETADLILSDVLGAVSGAQSAATLQIADNDVSNGTTNPIDSVEGFVRQQYLDFLNREPDAAGFQFWTTTLQNNLAACGTANTPAAGKCRSVARARVSEAFFLSIEFQQTGYLVYLMYVTALDPAARPRGLPRYSEFVRDTQTVGRDIVVGQAGFEQKLEDNKVAFAREFVSRPEFKARYDALTTAATFVDALYTNAGLTATRTTQERNAAIAAFGTGDADGRARALRSVAGTRDLFFREFNKAYVLMQYFGYLRRNPDDAPDSNFNGYDFWLAKLNLFSGDYRQYNSAEAILVPARQADMAEAFINSSEYRGRFGP